jgi:hypothetical protein
MENLSTGPGDVVYAVHTTGPFDVGPVEIVFGSEEEARTHAMTRSQAPRVLAASVTRYVVGRWGTRDPVAWYVDGVEQPPVPAHCLRSEDDRRLYAQNPQWWPGR